MCYGQRLSIEETVDYINQVLLEDLSKSPSNPLYQTKYSTIVLSPNGYITQGIFKFQFYFDDVRIEKKYYSRSCEIHFNCKKVDKYSFDEPNCITVGLPSQNGNGSYDYTPKTWWRIMAWDSYSLDRLYNAFQYLFFEMKGSGRYNRGENDPFSPSNYGNNEANIIGRATSEVIPLLSTNGVYEIWVNIGIVKKKFVLDSGASDVTISNDVEKELIKLGVVKKEYYLSSSLYRIADGSIISCRRFILPSLTVGKFTVKNLTISVSNSMLLGKGFLDKFSRWSIDNNLQSLHLEK